MASLAALRVLVVDDNHQMRTILGTVLAAAGVRQLYFANDGKQGLEVISRGSIDVAYVDYEMPVMNGLDFVAAVRGMKAPDCYMPLIMVTGHADLSRLKGARDRGIHEFLCKPVTARAILERLSAVIDQSRPFVKAKHFFGPDRRRRRADVPEERRGRSAGDD